MTERLEIKLPWPPSMNHYWRSIVRKPKRPGAKLFARAIISEDGRKFQRDVVHHLIHWKRAFTGRLAVEIELCAPTRARLDLDNRLKPLLDAMQHAGVYLDDSQIDELMVRRGPTGKPGHAKVVVREVGG